MEYGFYGINTLDIRDNVCGVTGNDNGKGDADRIGCLKFSILWDNYLTRSIM